MENNMTTETDKPKRQSPKKHSRTDLMAELERVNAELQECKTELLKQFEILNSPGRAEDESQREHQSRNFKAKRLQKQLKKCGIKV